MQLFGKLKIPQKTQKHLGVSDTNKLNIILNPSEISLLNTVINFLKQRMKTKTELDLTFRSTIIDNLAVQFCMYLYQY